GDVGGGGGGAGGFLGGALGRGAKPDGGAAGDQQGPIGVLRRFKRRRNRGRIVTVDPGRGPARRFEALDLIDRVRERGGAVDGNTVVVVQHRQLVQLQMAGERDRFLAHPLPEVAVGRQNVSGVVDEVGAKNHGEWGL